MNAMKRGEKRGPYASAAKSVYMNIIKECVKKEMAARNIEKADPYIAVPVRALRECAQKMDADESVTMSRKPGGGRETKGPSLKKKICAPANSDGVSISWNERGLARKFEVCGKAARVDAKKLGLKNVAKSKGARMAAKNDAHCCEFAKYITKRMGD